MGKRIFCLICAAALVMMAFGGIQAEAAAWDGPRLLPPGDNGLRLAKGLVSHKPNPLASAMILVLAGVAVSMLFDKKK